jgi:TonB family protein
MHTINNSYTCQNKLLYFCIIVSILWHIVFVHNHKIESKHNLQTEKPAVLLVNISSAHKDYQDVSESNNDIIVNKKQSITLEKNKKQKKYSLDCKKIASKSANEDINVKYKDSLYFIKKVIPKYPLRARQLKQEGDVELFFSYTNGKVKSINVRKSSGYKLLDKAAVEAVMQYLFISNANGASSVTFSFRLQDLQ